MNKAQPRCSGECETIANAESDLIKNVKTVKRSKLLFIIFFLPLSYGCNTEKVVENKSLEEQFLGDAYSEVNKVNYIISIPDPILDTLVNSFKVGRMGKPKGDFGPKSLFLIPKEKDKWREAHAIAKRYLDRTRDSISYYHANQYISLYMLDNFLLDREPIEEIQEAINSYLNILIQYDNYDFLILAKALNQLEGYIDPAQFNKLAHRLTNTIDSVNSVRNKLNVTATKKHTESLVARSILKKCQN